uniref:30S ribosomal protein S15 n=1 Tax=Erodium texanum TaxID=28960 RepID=B7T316_EROTE|nr:ribosomal protein S15 [Erodium texanum]ACH47306.1 ribosomal protein S15 [Erodium texanum]ADJ66335.1 ribosomal protein S15 [Erodium texanum]
MVKTPSISVISQEEKNWGSVEFQVVFFSNKIERISSHLKFHRKDYLSQRGLHKLLAKRERLLSYLSKKNFVGYKELIIRFNIRESKTSQI